MPDKSNVIDPVDTHFWPVYWGRNLGYWAKRSMGIYCDPAQPALAQFPTREHSDWQWYSLLTDAYALKLNKLPLEFEPTVFMIDEFCQAHRLGMVLEAKVSKGSLLVSTLNLGRKGERTLPQRQMLRSLLARAGADDFRPAHSLSIEQLEGVFREPEAEPSKTK
jgi:hypothetical protein